ncbi:MAG TPA: diguanylate cyclase [Acidobacteriota bacterium]|nr:diguanylate cyclase [Acidobacteriota bacterium]
MPRSLQVLFHPRRVSVLAAVRLGLAVSLTVWPLTVAAQQLNFTRYTVATGLPASRVHTVLQDRRGYLWFGTSGGLARYDGSEFRRFTVAGGLVGSTIVALAEAADGSIVFAAQEGGVGVIDNGVARVLLGDGLDGAIVRSIYPDPVGPLWFATARGLVKTTAEGPRRVVADSDVPPGCCSAVAVDVSSRTWVGGAGGLYRLQRDRLRLQDVGLPSGVAVTVLIVDSGGTLWVGTDRGLFRLVGDRLDPLPEATGKHVLGAARSADDALWFGTDRGALRVNSPSVEVYDDSTGLGDDRVNAVLADHEGNVWFGTDSGAAKLVSSSFATYSTAHGLPGDFVVALDADSTGTVWAATRGGVVSFRGAGDPTVELDVNLDAAGQITALAATEGELIVGTTRGLLRAPRGRSPRLIRGPVVRALHRYGGVVWVGTDSGLHRVSGERIAPALAGPRLADAPVTAIVTDRRGRLWVATRDRGVWLQIDGGFVRPDKEEDWQRSPVWSLAPAPDGSIWAATNGHGAVRFLPDGSTSALTRDGNGLASDFVHQVVVDQYGRVWLYTNRGLDRWDPSLGVSHFDLGDGLVAAAGNPGAAVAGNDGRLWFGTPSGVTVFRPGVRVSLTVPPMVVIRSVLVDGEPANESTLADLPPGHNNVTIAFSALSYRDESSSRFQYRLLGQSEVWSRPTEARVVSFADLAPGEYTFELQAINESGLWSRDPARVRFAVRPEPWETNWFRAALVALAVCLVGVLFRSRLRQVEDDRRRLRRMVDLRTRELVEKNAQLERMATTDELTGLPNRRFFLDNLERELRKLTRVPTDQHLSLLVLDLDRFKTVNDRFGHAAGDEVLRLVARGLAQTVRATDLPARFGGEEFAILLPNTGAEGARFLAEKLRTEVEAERIRFDGHDLAVTISVGVATLSSPSRYDDAIAEDLLKRADEAMYQAKSGGRNRVVAAAPPQPST